MNIDSVQSMEQDVERLLRREPEAMAAFIVSLAQDTGPVGEQVRTFIHGDEVEATVASVGQRIESIGKRSNYDYRHCQGEDVGRRLGVILDSIENLVLPVDAGCAFELLVLFMRCDGPAMESCGDHDYSVACAFEKAAQLIERTIASLPSAEVAGVLKELLAEDSYGVRKPLAPLLSGAPQGTP